MALSTSETPRAFTAVKFSYPSHNALQALTWQASSLSPLCPQGWSWKVQGLCTSCSLQTVPIERPLQICLMVRITELCGQASLSSQEFVFLCFPQALP